MFQQLVAADVQPLAVEPNLRTHPSISLTPWNEAVAQADIVVFLVAHREFKSVNVNAKVLDFCGVTQA